MQKTLSRTALYFSALLLAVCIPRVSFALTLTPIRYEISGNPGEVLEQKITVVNETKNAQVYFISFANFEAQGDTGSPTFVTPREGLGTWITTDEASINLKPGQQKIMNFRIAIPKNAEPGGYFAALFFGTSPGSGAPGEVSIGTKTGALILLSVLGDVKEEAGLVDFQLRDNKHFYKMLPVGFQYRFSNQGGDRVKPKGHIVIRSIFGWTVKKINANPVDGNVLPRTTRKFTPEWSKRDSVALRDEQGARKEAYSFKKAVSDEWHNFAFGVFRAKVVAEFGFSEQKVKSNSVYFVVFPWELLLVIAVIFFVLYKILRIFIKRYNRAIIKKAQAQFINNQRSV